MTFEFLIFRRDGIIWLNLNQVRLFGGSLSTRRVIFIVHSDKSVVHVVLVYNIFFTFVDDVGYKRSVTIIAKNKPKSKSTEFEHFLRL